MLHPDQALKTQNYAKEFVQLTEKYIANQINEIDKEASKTNNDKNRPPSNLNKLL